MAIWTSLGAGWGVWRVSCWLDIYMDVYEVRWKYQTQVFRTVENESG